MRLISAGFLVPICAALAFFLVSELLAIRADFDQITQSNRTMIQLSSQALLLEEGMSAALELGIGSGADQQAARHTALSDRLDRVLHDAHQLSPKLVESLLPASLGPGATVVQTENTAWKLILSGKGLEAKNLLSGESYRSEKQSYTSSLAKLNSMVIRQGEEQADGIKRRALIVVAALGGLIASLIASILFAYSSVKAARGFDAQQRAMSALEGQKKVLAESEESFRALFERSTDASLIIKEGKFVQCNQAALQVLGIDDPRTIEGHPPEVLSPPVQPCGTPSTIKSKRMMAKAQVSGFHRFEWVHLRADGVPFDVEVMLTAMKVNGEEVMHVIWRDITERKEGERKLKASEERFRSLIKSMQDMVLVLDETDRIQAVHQPRGFGLPGQTADLRGARIQEIGLPDDTARKIVSAIAETRRGSASLRVEYSLEHAYGLAWYDMNLSPYHAAVGGACWVTCVVRDITRNKKDEQALERQAAALASANLKLERLANHDALTGLANRRIFLEEVGKELELSASDRTGLAILFVDLDNFKSINDTYGHESGDLILVHTARSLEQSLRKDCLAARFGGDEFAVLLKAPATAQEAEAVATRIVKAIQTPIRLKGREVTASCSIGVAVSEPGLSLDEMVRRADSSMYFAKRSGKARWRTFEPSMAEELSARTALESDLKQALKRGEFDLAFQPVFSIHPLQPVQVEALLRWRNPRLGQVSPAEFIPIAEELGLINEIGAWVLEESCRRHGSWRGMKLAAGGLRLAVNCSAIQLQTLGFPERVADILSATQMPPRLVTLEVTETAMVSDMEPHWDKLEALRLMGVQLAIDDFGAGYSSMGALVQLPLDCVKIDRSFVQSLGSSRESDAILRAVQALCGELGLDVVAEGIETFEQLDHVAKVGCQRAQGFLLGRPMNESDLHLWLQSAPWLQLGADSQAA